MSDEYLKLVEHRLNGRIDDMKEDLSGLRVDLKDHMQNHTISDKRMVDMGEKVARHEAILPKMEKSIDKLTDSMDKLAEGFNRFSINMAVNDARTGDNTKSREKTESRWMKIFYLVLSAFIGWLVAGGNA